MSNVGASVRARLLSHAKDSGYDYGLLLTKYALERILYRLSVSPWRDTFLLKGALLFDLWFDQPHRPTRDIDLLGFGSSEVDDVAAVFRNVCALACEDGITFDATTVRAAEIRKEANYAGVRVALLGILYRLTPTSCRKPLPRRSCGGEPQRRRSCRWVCQRHLHRTVRKFNSGRLFSARTSYRHHRWMNWSASYAHCYGGSMLSFLATPKTDLGQYRIARAFAKSMKTEMTVFLTVFDFCLAAMRRGYWLVMAFNHTVRYVERMLNPTAAAPDTTA